jgi:hypothetical protein
VCRHRSQSDRDFRRDLKGRWRGAEVVPSTRKLQLKRGWSSFERLLPVARSSTNSDWSGGRQLSGE